jgi:predicted O-methyltransferase YrrM
VVKRAYVSGVRAVRSLARLTGLLAVLDRWADRSRVGLWLRSLLAIHDVDDLLRLDVPWWTFVAADEVERHLASRPTSSVFEWGSGASTHWLAARSTRSVSIEHDPEWAERVGAGLAANARLVVVEPDEWRDTGVARSSKRGFEHLDFSAYVAAIAGHPGPYDVIVIDGRAREACLAASEPHLASDGIIVFDDTERRRYRRAIAQIPSLSVRWTFGLTPCVPYPAGTALLRRRGASADRPRNGLPPSTP